MNALNPDNRPGLLAFGEVMMRLECGAGRRFTQVEQFDALFGGAEANVCALLSGLGWRTRLVTAFPDNELGVAASNRLQGFGIEVGGLRLPGCRMGLYFTENGHLLRASRVIYDRKDSAFARLKPGQVAWAQESVGFNWFHWSGISPAVSASAAATCQEALESAQRSGLRISGDLNYRSSLWDYGRSHSEVMPQLLSFNELLTGDLHAAARYFGFDLDAAGSEEDQFRYAVACVREKLPRLQAWGAGFRQSDAQGRQSYLGALFLRDQIYFSRRSFLPEIVDRIGTGDAFAAGLLYGYQSGWEGQEMVEFATATAVLKHSIFGDLAWLSEKEIRQFLRDGPGQKVIR
jgi:2-dehydro-3-deoxygluconokinase